MGLPKQEKAIVTEEHIAKTYCMPTYLDLNTWNGKSPKTNGEPEDEEVEDDDSEVTSPDIMGRITLQVLDGCSRCAKPTSALGAMKLSLLSASGASTGLTALSLAGIPLDSSAESSSQFTKKVLAQHNSFTEESEEIGNTLGI